MIMVHLALLLATAAIAFVLILLDPGLANRPLRRVLYAAAPLFALGLVSSMLMSVGGVPLTEWALPVALVLCVGIFCKSERLLTIAAVTMFLAAIALTGSFLYLTTHGYTAAPDRSLNHARIRQKAQILAAGGALRKRFSADAELRPGPVASLLEDPRFNEVEVVHAERLWHTPITRLYRVQRDRETLWCPGGNVQQASRALSLRTSP